MSPDDEAMLAELRRRGDPVSLRAADRFETYHRMDREAATHVESVIAMRTSFTGDEPYVGWKGIGLALVEALDERDRLRDSLPLPEHQDAARYHDEHPRFDRLIAIAAFRYALGRASYIVGHVTAWLLVNRQRLSSADRALIVREIDEASEMKRLGMDCDETRWKRCRAAMVEQGA